MIVYLAIAIFVVCIVAVVFGIYFVRFYCDLECNNLWEICGYILSKFPKDFIHTFNGNKDDWGTFGDFIGGTLNPILSFFGFMALLYTVRMQRKQLDDTDKFQAKQQFESTFFELLKMHNQALENLCKKSSENDITNLQKVLVSLNLSKTPSLIPPLNLKGTAEQFNLEKHKNFYLYGDYFRILYQLLKFVATNAPGSKVSTGFEIKELEKDTSDAEKMYSNIIRASLPNDLIPLVVVYAYCEKGAIDYSYYKFRLLVERYAFFENHLFETSNDSIYLESWSFFALRAFGNAKDPRKSIMKNNNENWSFWLKIKNGIILKIGSCRLFFMRW